MSPVGRIEGYLVVVESPASSVGGPFGTLKEAHAWTRIERHVPTGAAYAIVGLVPVTPRVVKKP